MKIFEVTLPRAGKKIAKSVDDLDDVLDKPEDPDADKVPHIVMQLRKASDVDGDYHITFKNGKKYKLKLKDIQHFLHKYERLKPIDREKMQQIASTDIDGFHKALETDFKKPELPKIKGSRYMSNFAGDFDDK